MPSDPAGNPLRQILTLTDLHGTLHWVLASIFNFIVRGVVEPEGSHRLENSNARYEEAFGSSCEEILSSTIELPLQDGCADKVRCVHSRGADEVLSTIIQNFEGTDRAAVIDRADELRAAIRGLDNSPPRIDFAPPPDSTSLSKDSTLLSQACFPPHYANILHYSQPSFLCSDERALGR